MLFVQPNGNPITLAMAAFTARTPRKGNELIAAWAAARQTWWITAKRPGVATIGTTLKSGNNPTGTPAEMFAEIHLAITMVRELTKIELSG